jgi:putative hydrolase of HD superfamily
MPMPNNKVEGRTLPRFTEAEADITVMRASLGLQMIRRYLDQQHWTQESTIAHAADAVEPGLKLENVAAHSWHVADAALLLASHFPHLRLDRALQLAILHDKLELITGDFDPVGTDGQGGDSHAFNPAAGQSKIRAELLALDQYIASLREPARTQQRELMLDVIHIASDEARFVMAVDKLQALTYVLEKKDGKITDDHLVFSLRYSAKAVEYFSGLEVHFGILVRLLIERVAGRRSTTCEVLMMGLPAPARALVQRYTKDI